MGSGKYLILRVYKKFLSIYGHQNWWPADSKFEVVLGAILTQSTSWTNVTLALNNIKAKKLLNAKKLLTLNIEELELLIKPSGYYKQKAKKIISFLNYFKIYNFNFDNMSSIPTSQLRKELLAVWGIGEETADAILSYAIEKPILVVDTYTSRFTYRLGLTNENIKYCDLQKYLMDILPFDNEIYKDFHAQIVWHSKCYCTKIPHCSDCILRQSNLCEYNLG